MITEVTDVAEGSAWDTINVLSGEGWLALIGLALFLIGMAIGYVIGQQKERAKHSMSKDAWDDRPGGSHRPYNPGDTGNI